MIGSSVPCRVSHTIVRGNPPPTGTYASVPLFETKLFVGVVGPTAVGWLLFRRAQRGARAAVA